MTHADTNARELKAEEADVAVDPSGFGFKSTDELEPLDEILGQPRAMKALDLGLGIRHRNYNIYVSGLSGTGKKQTIRRVLNERVTDGVPPSGKRRKNSEMGNAVQLKWVTRKSAR